MVNSSALNGLLFAKNCSSEGPGQFKAIADSRHIPFTEIDLSRGDSLPDLAAVKAVVMLGGPMSANDPGPHMASALDLTEKVLRNGTPFLGVCLGMQLLVKAAGGVVRKHAIKEVGIYAPDGQPWTMVPTDAAEKDALFGSISNAVPPSRPGDLAAIPVFHLHGETVQPPTDAVHLMLGHYCTWQALRIGNSAWGIQGHVEINDEILSFLLREDADLSKQDQITVLKDFEAFSRRYSAAAYHIFNRFLIHAGL